MAVQLLSKVDGAAYVGLEADTKPTTDVTPRSRFFEFDTQDWYFWDGSAWVLDSGQPIQFAARSWEDVTNAVAVVEQGQFEHEYVAASASAQILGVTGGVGDLLHGVLIVPETTAAGSVSVTDGNGTARVIFTGGGTLSDLKPFFIPFNAVCVNATTPGWKITTGTNVHAIGIGRFTA